MSAESEEYAALRRLRRESVAASNLEQTLLVRVNELGARLAALEKKVEALEKTPPA